MSAENADVDENLSEGPENITLMPAEERTAKARCTMRTTRIKQEQESDDEAEELQRTVTNQDHKNVYMMELSSNSAGGQTMSQTIGKNKSYLSKEEEEEEKELFIQ